MTEWIVAFGNSVWQWILDNEDEIMAFIMSGQFASLIVAIIALFRQFKQVKMNTNSTNALNQTMENTNRMGTSVDTLLEDFRKLKIENDYLRNELKETEEHIQHSNLEIANKLNAILEVQSVVYSTIRDENVRQTVNTLLNNARYSEKNFKESLEKQLEELKNEYRAEMTIMNAKVDDGISKITDSMHLSESVKNHESQRY